MPFLPLVAFASNTTLSIKDVMYRMSYYILNPLIKLGFIIATAYLMWTIIQFIRDRNRGYVFGPTADDKRAGRKGIEDILWGLAGLLIMVSAFAIMQLIVVTIGSDIQTP